MATSVFVSMDDAVGGFEESMPENAKQKGRRKSNSTEKKKQPQRGMGVAQLERLRLQERWKKMTQDPIPQPHNTNSQTNHYFLPTTFPDPKSFGSSYGGVGLNHQGFLLQKLGNGGFSEQAGMGQVQADPCGFGSSNWGFRAENEAHETSKELSSMPNLSCYSGQCCLCPKKKLGNGENLGCNGMRDKYAGCSFVGLTLRNQQNVDQEKEVLAVHRKGSSGGGRVLMEYEFFPGKGSRSTCSKDMEFGLSSEDSVAVDVGDQGSCLATRINSTGFGASNSIDLSLKLSN